MVSFSQLVTLRAKMAAMAFTVLVLSCLCNNFGANAKSANSLQSANQMAEASQEDKPQIYKDLISCIDDTDCQSLGEGNQIACFAYICYPWKNDENLRPEDKKTQCRRSSDCRNEGECVKHPDRRAVNTGLCFDELDECEDESDCKGDDGCCGGYCCPKKFSDKFKTLPCLSHLGCQDLGLGQFCCPQKTGNSSICCNDDPDAPPITPSPKNSPSVGSAINLSSPMALIFLSMVAVIVLAVRN